MALTIEQLAAVSFPAVLAEMRNQNQWAENAALRELERQGAIKRVSLGATIEATLDYRPNPDSAVLANDQDVAALVKTEIVTAASYDIAQISVPVTWTKGDEAKNPTENQKISLVKQILENGVNSHDDLVEQCIFTTSTAGGTELTGLADLISTAGTGTVGGIDASVETWWRNQADTYVDASDIEAGMTSIWNACIKGSGSSLQPSLLLGGSDPFNTYEAQLQTMQRFVDSSEANGGYTKLAFKTAPCVFSQYGASKIYFLNPKNYQIVVSKQYFRDKGDTQTVPGQNAFYFLIYSALQAIVNNRSRLGVLSAA